MLFLRSYIFHLLTDMNIW